MLFATIVDECIPDMSMRPHCTAATIVSECISDIRPHCTPVYRCEVQQKSMNMPLYGNVAASRLSRHFTTTCKTGEKWALGTKRRHHDVVRTNEAVCEFCGEDKRGSV